MKKYLLLMMAVFLLGSCNQTEELNIDSNQIRVKAEIASGSRATLTNFEVDDSFGLFAVERIDGLSIPVQVGGNYLNNEKMTYDGTEWSSQRTLYWSDSDVDYDFYGIYPYMDITSIDAQLFEVATDQSIMEDGNGMGAYEISDLMFAVDNGVKKGEEVSLAFKHMMSRVVVKVVKGAKYEGEIPTDIVVHIYNTATTAKVNWQKGSLEKYLYSGKKTIKMRPLIGGDEPVFDAIVVPQFIERSTPLVEITMGGIAYLLEYSMTFRPGYQHTIIVTLNTSPDQEKIEIQIDGEVEDWQQ